jgi:hypothetical protein
MLIIPLPPAGEKEGKITHCKHCRDYFGIKGHTPLLKVKMCGLIANESSSG